MAFFIDDENLKNFILVGDRVLIKPKTPDEKTKTGLFLPPGVQEKEKIQNGYVVKVGPGYPIPVVSDDDEPWKNQNEQIRYVPLQAVEGDLAIFLSNSGFELVYRKEKYFIIPHSAILMLIRDDSLFE